MNDDAAIRISVLVERRDFDLDVDLEIRAGQRLAIVGPSGAGKTTILKTIAGLLKPARGRIDLGGQVLFDSETKVDLPPEDRRCGFVPQDYSLFPHLTALANVSFGIRGVKGPERKRRSAELLDLLGLGSKAAARPDELSGGERQRVALARALATDPAVFLLDEPLAALDPDTRDQAIPVIQDILSRTGTPALIVTHSRAEADRLADTTVTIDSGRVSGVRPHDAGMSRRSAGSMSIHRTLRKAGRLDP